MKVYLHKRKCRHCDDLQDRRIYKFSLFERLRIFVFGNFKTKWKSKEINE